MTKDPGALKNSVGIASSKQHIGICDGPPGVGKTPPARHPAKWDLLDGRDPLSAGEIVFIESPIRGSLEAPARPRRPRPPALLLGVSIVALVLVVTTPLIVSATLSVSVNAPALIEPRLEMALSALFSVHAPQLPAKVPTVTAPPD